MKEVSVKRFVLSRETVANLNMLELSNVKGGQVTRYCDTGDNCTFGCTGPAVTPGTRCC